MEIVEFGILLWSGRHRRAAQYARLAICPRSTGQLFHLGLLDVHAADQNDVCPGQFCVAHRSDVLVDEADLPSLRQVGSDDENSLWWHEGPHPVHQWVGILKRAE